MAEVPANNATAEITRKNIMLDKERKRRKEAISVTGDRDGTASHERQRGEGATRDGTRNAIGEPMPAAEHGTRNAPTRQETKESRKPV